MNKLYIVIAAGLLAGFAGAAILLRATGPEPVAAAPAGPDQPAAAEDRLRALETAVAAERDARMLLEEELLLVFTELEALRRDTARIEADGPRAQPEERRPPMPEVFRGRRGGVPTDETRVAALIDAGFPTDRAAWIIRREDELRLEAMQARFEAQRAGDMQAMFAARMDSESALRAELGETEYERYLEAYGRPTTVAVGSVLESSPGQRAGLEAGDEIVRYDGLRVFSYADINAGQLQGEPGESVVVDILRDGVPLQIVLPRGPIGIQAGRWRR